MGYVVILIIIAVFLAFMLSDALGDLLIFCFPLLFCGLVGIVFWLSVKCAEKCIKTANKMSKPGANPNEWGFFWLCLGGFLGFFIEAILLAIFLLITIGEIPTSITNNLPYLQYWIRGDLGLLIILILEPLLIGITPVVLFRLYVKIRDKVKAFLTSQKEIRDEKKRDRTIAKISREIEWDNETVCSQIPRLKELQAMQLSGSDIAQAEHLISLLDAVGEPSSSFLEECHKRISKQRQLLKEKEKIEGAILEIAQKFKEIGNIEKYEYYLNLVSHTTYSTSRKY